jgi:hypothetical protein
MAPVCWHCVVHWFDSCCWHVLMLLDWHSSWHEVFACAVHTPVQEALHLVVQSAVVGTLVHCVEQWSSQHAPHEAVHWEEDSLVELVVPPSSLVELEELELHEALQDELQLEVQLVSQSNEGGLVWHCVVQLDSHWLLQVASADEVHFALHDCSSCAAHAFTHCAGAHWVEQLLSRTSVQFALASISMLPHAESVLACAGRSSRAVAAKATAAKRERERARDGEVLIARGHRKARAMVVTGAGFARSREKDVRPPHQLRARSGARQWRECSLAVLLPRRPRRSHRLTHEEGVRFGRALAKSSSWGAKLPPRIQSKRSFP